MSQEIDDLISGKIKAASFRAELDKIAVAGLGSKAKILGSKAVKAMKRLGRDVSGSDVRAAQKTIGGKFPGLVRRRRIARGIVGGGALAAAGGAGLAIKKPATN